MGDNKVKRLFTFGCSFTNYRWPTWADFIGQSYDVYENWGAPGAGNYYIASKLFECNQVNKLTKKDTVLVMLSSFTRFDYIAPNSEHVISGNVYSQTNISKEFLSNYWSEEYGFHMTWFCLNSIINFLENIGCEYRIMSAFNLAKKELDYYTFEGFNKPLMMHTSDFVMMNVPESNLKDYSETKRSDEGLEYYSFNNSGMDTHPTIKIHHDWVKDELPEFYNDEMVNLMNAWEPLIDKDQDQTVRNFSDVFKTSKEINDFKKISRI